MEVSGQLHAPAALTPGKSPWHPLDKRLGGPQSQSGRGGEEKNLQSLPGLEPPIIQTIGQRYTTELSWLLLNGVDLLYVGMDMCSMMLVIYMEI
jgi:hypothetical protein